MFFLAKWPLHIIIRQLVLCLYAYMYAADITARWSHILPQSISYAVKQPL